MVSVVFVAPRPARVGFTTTPKVPNFSPNARHLRTQRWTLLMEDAVGRQSAHQARGGASRQLAIDREFLVLADRRHADLLGHIAAMARALLRGGLVGLLGRPQALTDGARDRRQALLARRCGPLWRLHGLSHTLSNAAI